MLAVMAVVAAACSSIVFTCFSADAYLTAAGHGQSRRAAAAESAPYAKKIFKALEAERILTGSAYLCMAAASALIVAFIALAILRKGGHISMFAVTVSITATVSVAWMLFMARYALDPREAFERLCMGTGTTAQE